MALTRRNWMKTAGAGLATAPSALAAFGNYFQAAAGAPAGWTRLVTACGICDSTCGMQVTLRDGVVRFIEGLPGDAHGGGGLCGKGAAGAALLYDPDRLK